MLKNNIFGWGVPMALLGALAAYLASSSCSGDEPSPREIRAHLEVKKGIAHAEPMHRSERFCGACHGVGLAGGTALEPSCYSCHGQNWIFDRADLVAAPADHQTENGGYMHRSGLFDPQSNCSSCHRIDPEDETSGLSTLPSCQLCHGKLWEERSAP